MCELGAAWLCRASWMDEHTDVDDGRRASVSLALSAAGHARRIPRRVGVWVVGKRKERSVAGCLGKRKTRFYLPCMGMSQQRIARHKRVAKTRAAWRVSVGGAAFSSCVPFTLRRLSAGPSSQSAGSALPTGRKPLGASSVTAVGPGWGPQLRRVHIARPAPWSPRLRERIHVAVGRSAPRSHGCSNHGALCLTHPPIGDGHILELFLVVRILPLFGVRCESPGCRHTHGDRGWWRWICLVRGKIHGQER